MKTVTRIQYNPEGEGKYLALPSDTITTLYGGKLSSTGLVINDVYEIDEIDLDGGSNKLFSTVANIASVQSQPRGIHPIIDNTIEIEGYVMANNSLPVEDNLYKFTSNKCILEHISDESAWIEKLSAISGLPPVLSIYKVSDTISLSGINLPSVTLDNRTTMSGYPIEGGNDTVLTPLPYNIIQSIISQTWSKDFFAAVGLEKTFFQGTPKIINLDPYGFVPSGIDLISNNKAYFSNSGDIKSFISAVPSDGGIVSLIKDNTSPICGLIAVLPKVSLSSGIILIGVTIGIGGGVNQVVQEACTLFNATLTGTLNTYSILPNIYRISSLGFLSTGVKNSAAGTSWLQPIPAVFNRADCYGKTLINIVTPQALSSEWQKGLKSIELCEYLADSEDWAILLNNVSLGMKIKVYGSTFLGGVYSWTSGDWTAPSSGNYVICGKGLYTVITKIYEE